MKRFNLDLDTVVGYVCFCCANSTNMDIFLFTNCSNKKVNCNLDVYISLLLDRFVNVVLCNNGFSHTAFSFASVGAVIPNESLDHFNTIYKQLHYTVTVCSVKQR